MKKTIIAIFVFFIISSLSLCYLLQIHWTVSIAFLFGHFMISGLIIEVFEKINSDSDSLAPYFITAAVSLCCILYTSFNFFCMDGRAFEKAAIESSIESYQKFIDKYPRSEYVSQAQDSLSLYQEYMENSLPTGSVPYIDVYKKNLEQGNARINIIAPSRNDIVVIIQSEDYNGLVVAHTYIRAKDEYTFTLPDGTYQTLFYSGKGWNPRKKIGQCVGGFVKGELFKRGGIRTLENECKTYDFSPFSRTDHLYEKCNREEIFR